MKGILQTSGAVFLFLLFSVAAGAQSHGGRSFRPVPAGHGGFRIVPGLGFDYPHLAAVSGNFSFGNEFRAGEGQGYITPVFLGGYPYVEPVPQQPQVIVVQAPAPVVVVQQPAPVTQAPAAPSPPKQRVAPAAQPDQSAPVHEVSAYVLVQRNGKILRASAYSVVGNNLLYITPEGMPHNMPLAQLDTAATRRMNEAQGVTFLL